MPEAGDAAGCVLTKLGFSAYIHDYKIKSVVFSCLSVSIEILLALKTVNSSSTRRRGK